jgi:hypothetical protein
MGYSMVNGRKIYFVGSDSFFNLQFTDNLGAWHCANPETIQSQVGSAGTNAILGLVSLAVTIPPPLIILSAPQLTVGKTNFAFLLSGPAGSNYVLQVSTNLLNWSSVSTSTIPVNGSITLSNAIGGYKQSFYRVLMQ